jgi:serine/threonine protein kinase
VQSVLQKATGKAYPQPIFDQLIALIQEMLDSNPNNRPSAKDIAQRLRSIGRGNWEVTEEVNPKRFFSQIILEFIKIFKF